MDCCGEGPGDEVDTRSELGSSTRRVGDTIFDSLRNRHRDLRAICLGPLLVLLTIGEPVVISTSGSVLITTRGGECECDGDTGCECGLFTSEDDPCDASGMSSSETGDDCVFSGAGNVARV